MGLDWVGWMGWDLCAGLFYEHRFAMLIIRKSAKFPKLGINRSGFSPVRVGDQMLSEITVVEGRKLAPLHCVKSESSKKIYNQIQSSQMVALINGLVPNFFFAD